MASINLYIYCLAIVLLIGSCTSSPGSHRENAKIFHAAPMSGGIGALYFGLYNDNTYQICNSSGLGQDCYSGKFKLDKDTLTLLDLNRDVPLRSNKLIIVRYNKQDSTYWEWKYSRQYESFSSDRTLGKWKWQEFKNADMVLGEGNVYQLAPNGIPIKDEYYFIIQLDSLKN